MEVFVTSVFGRTVSYIIDEDCTVAELKSLYAQEFETSCSSWYLMFEGKFLQNPFRLIHYNIRHGEWSVTILRTIITNIFLH